VSRVIVLDSGPLGLVTQPHATPQNEDCRRWMRSLLRQGARMVVPEIIDYELRRELLRGRKSAGLQRLDDLVAALQYVSLTTAVMRQAAEFWATARQRGRPTAFESALDIDVILAAQAKSLEESGDEVVIATTNVRHLSLFAIAREWSDLT
jgi:predicted nucleic acid-binding protein